MEGGELAEGGRVHVDVQALALVDEGTPVSRHLHDRLLLHLPHSPGSIGNENTENEQVNKYMPIILDSLTAHQHKLVQSTHQKMRYSSHIHNVNACPKLEAETPGLECVTIYFPAIQ